MLWILLIVGVFIKLTPSFKLLEFQLTVYKTKRIFWGYDMVSPILKYRQSEATFILQPIILAFLPWAQSTDRVPVQIFNWSITHLEFSYLIPFPREKQLILFKGKSSLWVVPLILFYSDSYHLLTFSFMPAFANNMLMWYAWQWLSGHGCFN